MPRPRLNFSKLKKTETPSEYDNGKQATISSFFPGIRKHKLQITSCETEDSIRSPQKKNKLSGEDEISGQENVCSVSLRTVEKIKMFSVGTMSSDKMDYSYSCSKTGSTEINSLTPTEKDTEDGKSGLRTVKYTPMEEQVLELKRKHAGMILMIQSGYKYMFFGEDAEIASRILNIMLTQHHNFQTAVIPIDKLHVHIRRIIDEGYKVGVVNQTETSAMKAVGSNKNAPFNRELANVYTKATLIGDDVDPIYQGEFVQGRNVPSYIMCVTENLEITSSQQKTTLIGIVAFDPSTGETVYDVFDDGFCREELERRLEHLQPAEILAPTTLSQETECILKYSSASLERLPDDLFNFTTALVRVSSFFSEQNDIESSSQNFQSMADLPPAVVACLSVLLHHLTQFGLDRALTPKGLRNFTSNSRYLQMDANVLRNLEIFQSGLGTNKGSLIWALDHTKTKFGSRLLHEWLSQPLRDPDALQSREDAVTDLLNSNSKVINELEEMLAGMPDIDRGLTTCIHQRCGPASLYTILRTLKKLRSDFQKLFPLVNEDLRSPFLQELFKETIDLLLDVDPFLQNINQQAAAVKDGEKPKWRHLLNDYSTFPSILNKQTEISEVLKKLDDMKPQISQYLGLLKFDYVTVGGEEFLIEVNISRKKSVPNSWNKVNETKHVTRYRSPDIESFVRRLNCFREQLEAECRSAWLCFVSDFNQHYFHHKKAVKNLATIDVLLSFAQVAKQEGYCRPTLVDSEETMINIVNGRHPIIPLLFSSEDTFVANDTALKSREQCCIILSGPNMGGKSCYMRQVALITIMAHIGSYVPAESATISILDSVFTRMGARDEMFRGRSTLMLELEETSVILKKATHRSVVLMDELGRGTSSSDGTAIAAATLHHLVTEIQCLTLFVTHFPHVMELENHYKGNARNYHMAFIVHDEVDDEESPEVLTFLYKVTSGSATKSYGLNVARLASLPPNILKKAAKKAEMLESWTNAKRTVLLQFKNLWFAENLTKAIKALR